MNTYESAADFAADYFPQADGDMLQDFADKLEGRAPAFAKMKATPGTQEWLDEWAATTTQTRNSRMCRCGCHPTRQPTYARLADVQAWLADELGEGNTTDYSTSGPLANELREWIGSVANDTVIHVDVVILEALTEIEDDHLGDQDGTYELSGRHTISGRPETFFAPNPNVGE